MAPRSSLLIATILCVLGSPARAETPLCLDVRADEDPSGLRRLVESEVAHHRSHRLTSEGCRVTLAVDLFRASGARYLTARIGEQVPVRFLIKTPQDLSERLTEAIRLVLGSDPVYLAEDLSRYSAVQRATLSLCCPRSMRRCSRSAAGSGSDPEAAPCAGAQCGARLAK